MDTEWCLTCHSRSTDAPYCSTLCRASAARESDLFYHPIHDTTPPNSLREVTAWAVGVRSSWPESFRVRQPPATPKHASNRPILLSPKQARVTRPVVSTNEPIFEHKSSRPSKGSRVSTGWSNSSRPMPVPRHTSASASSSFSDDDFEFAYASSYSGYTESSVSTPPSAAHEQPGVFLTKTSHEKSKLFTLSHSPSSSSSSRGMYHPLDISIPTSSLHVYHERGRKTNWAGV